MGSAWAQRSFSEPSTPLPVSFSASQKMKIPTSLSPVVMDTADWANGCSAGSRVICWPKVRSAACSRTEAGGEGGSTMTEAPQSNQPGPATATLDEGSGGLY